MNAPQHRQLESLISALCDGILEPQQHAQLEQLLRESAECRRIYLQYVDMHARLTVHPNLATGIPMGSDAALPGVVEGDSASQSALRDDEILLEVARSALDEFDRDADRAQKGRHGRAIARWLSLTIAVLIALFCWQAWEWQQETHGGPVVQELIGEATIGGSEGPAPAAVGRRLRRGEWLRTGADDASALLEYADGTKIIVCFNSTVQIPADGSKVHLRLLSGTMDVDAAPQSPDRPLVFATDHARYVVLGTRFRLYRETEASRLELGEGKVRLERQVDGETVEVSAGYLAVATSEPTPLEVQPMAKGRTELRASLRKAGQAVAFSADGNTLATSDWERGFKTWTPGESTPLDTHEGKVGRTSGLAFAGDVLVQVGSENRQDTVMLWRPGETSARTIPLSGEHARSRAVSPDGHFVAVSDNSGTHVYQLDIAKARRKSPVSLPDRGKAWCLALSESARFAAAGFWDGTVRVYRLAANGEEGDGAAESIVFERRMIHTPTQIALSNDGSLLAVFTMKDGLQMFDLSTAEQRPLWAAGGASIRCLQFSPDRTQLMAGLSDGTARMWAVQDGRALVVIDAGHVPNDIAWSPEQRLLATAGGEVKLWQCEIP